MEFLQGNTYYHNAFPQEEFDRNFKLMRSLGINAVRVAEIWPGWSVLEPVEGAYDYTELDAFVESAAANGLAVCMGVGIADTPFWLYRKYPDLRMRRTDGVPSGRRVQSACFDHMPYRAEMERFIRSITERYGKHPAVSSFQIGNETRYNVPICDCEATRLRFREWLRKQFDNDINRLNQEWAVRYQDFAEIYPYGSAEGPPTIGITPHYLASRAYQNWSIEELIASSVRIMRAYTDKAILHNNYGVSGQQGSHYEIAKACDKTVIDIYASTYRNPCFYQGLLLDMSRTIAAKLGQDLWIGEISAGQYGTYLRMDIDSRLAEACLRDLLGAAPRAIFHFRHKAPQYEQPHKYTGSQTFLRIDESELPYAQAPRRLAMWMAHHGETYMQAAPGKAQAVLYYPAENLQLAREVGYHAEALASAAGARAILAACGISVDVMDTAMMRQHGIKDYKLLLLPVSFLLPPEIGEQIRSFVRGGGIVISEGRPAYVNKLGWLYERQPGAGLHEVFGAHEDLYYNTDADYPVRIKLPSFEADGTLPYLKQTLRLCGGKPFLWDANGSPCGVYHSYGKGKAYLLGGAPSLYFDMGSGKYDTGIRKPESPQLQRQREIYAALYAAIAAECGVLPLLEQRNCNPKLSVRMLEYGREHLYFLTNFDNTTESLVHLPKGTQILADQGRVAAPVDLAIRPYESICVAVERKNGPG